MIHKCRLYFIAFFCAALIISCKDDEPDFLPVPLKDYTEQLNEDITLIEDFLRKYTFQVTDTPGLPEDQDIVFEKIEQNELSIFSFLNSSTYPSLRSRTVKFHGIDYKLYYLVLREGTKSAPTNVDGVFSAFNGMYLSYDSSSNPTTTTFQEVAFPQSVFPLNTAIKSWGEVFPQFYTGTSVTNENGTVSHYDFGAGVMFVPSGLGYYNTGSGIIPPYKPLIFSFKLYQIQRLDHDGDGVLSVNEDRDNNNYTYDYRDLTGYPEGSVTDEDRYKDDTDKDGTPDYLDTDDDGDNYSTRIEITNPVTSKLYEFDKAPKCSTVPIYLDKSCNPKNISK